MQVKVDIPNHQNVGVCRLHDPAPGRHLLVAFQDIAQQQTRSVARQLTVEIPDAQRLGPRAAGQEDGYQTGTRPVLP